MTKLEKIVPQDFVVSERPGGKTTQIIIEPPGALYIDRDFHFRLSSATMELEESDFISLLDYDRIIAPVEGEFSLTYNGSKTPVILRELECAVFDGAWKTCSHGRVVDYNLMTRKGICWGNTSVLIVGVGQTVEIHCESGEQGCSVLPCWCVQGGAELSAGGEITALSLRDAARLEVVPGGAAVNVKAQNQEDPPVRPMVARASFLP